MAYRYRRRRGFRSYRRRRLFRRGRRASRFSNRYRRSRRLPRRLFGQSRTKLVKLRYFSEKNFASNPTGVPYSIWFRANGPYDPEVQVGGQQPTGWDIWTGLYAKYRVLKTNVTLTFTHNSIETSFVCGLLGDQDASRALNTPRAFTEQNSSIWKSVAPSGSGDHLKTVKMSLRPYRSLALPFREDTYASHVMDIPVSQWFVNAFCWADMPYNDNIICNMKVTVDYYVQFFDPLDIVTS